MDIASQFVARAAARGAQLICFPESFPGAWRQPVTWTPVHELCQLARNYRLYIAAGFAEPVDPNGGACYQSVSLISPAGAETGRYRRTSPGIPPWIYRGGSYWDFDWVPAVDLPVFETEIGHIGLLICSEVYVPELARVLAIRGADIVLMPNGVVPPTGGLFDTWRILLQARAIENLIYTATSSNLVGHHSRGLAMVCSPENVILENQEEGLHIAELDFGRLRWLREQSDVAGTNPPWSTKPGVLRDWRRKEVLEANPV